MPLLEEVWIGFTWSAPDVIYLLLMGSSVGSLNERAWFRLHLEEEIHEGLGERGASFVL